MSHKTPTKAFTPPLHPLPATQVSPEPDSTIQAVSNQSNPPTQAADTQPSSSDMNQSIPTHNHIPHPTTVPSSDPPTPSNHLLPPLPLRNYDTNHQDLETYKIYSSARSNSNSILIRFLISLSNFVLFGGSLTGLVVFIYQRYIFPRLKIRDTILNSLKTSALKSYSILLEQIRELARSNPSLYRSISKSSTDSGASSGILGPENCVESELGRDNRSERSLGAPKSDQSSVKPAPESNLRSNAQVTQPADGAPDHSDSDPRHATPSPAHINQPIYDALSNLSRSIRRRQNLGLSTDSEIQPVTAVQNLADSLEGCRLDLFNKHSYHLNAHSFSSPKSSYFSKLNPPRPQPPLSLEGQSVRASDQTTDEKRARKVMEDNKKALSEFKAEIRTLKGMLLNRRNFAGWRTSTSDGP